MKPDYDTTVARIAGNIASGRTWDELNVIPDERIAGICVSLARAIVAEVKRTAPSRPQDEPAP
jgi:hypothetical protein